MSDSIHIDVAGDRQAGLRFEEFPDALYDDLKAEIDALSNELFGRVQAATPDKTGDLRSKERYRLFTDESRITGYVSVAAADQNEIRKAGALEYGSKGKKTPVASHAMKLDHHWSHKLAAPQSVIVAAYERLPNIAERNFLRGPLNAMRPEIVRRLNELVSRAVQAANT